MRVPAKWVHCVEISIAIDSDGFVAVGKNAKTGEILQESAYAIIVPMDCLMKMQEPA